MNERKCKSALRIIPARAGQTPREWHQLIAGADHPRACGANSIGFRCAHSASGSSPRVRGKLMRIALMIMNIRIIPARAGQTDNITRLRGLRLDHPRACGANMDLNIANAYRPGSSPRVRGKLVFVEDAQIPLRIIPARAGQTCQLLHHERLPPDHPRACGANLVQGEMVCDEFGSSPRVRGKLIHPTVHRQSRRIIPARAGQTCMVPKQGRIRSDHPRACGANVDVRGEIVAAYGSSPRVRGKHRERVRLSKGRWIIPARAGQTCTLGAGWPRCPDHPRACGANSGVFTLSADISGSSPRVRGKPSDFMRKLLSAGPSIIGFAQWLQSSCYCSCFQSSAKTPISRGTTPTSLFLGFQNSITLLLLT